MKYNSSQLLEVRVVGEPFFEKLTEAGVEVYRPKTGFDGAPQLGSRSSFSFIAGNNYSCRVPISGTRWVGSPEVNVEGINYQLRNFVVSGEGIKVRRAGYNEPALLPWEQLAVAELILPVAKPQNGTQNMKVS